MTARTVGLLLEDFGANSAVHQFLLAEDLCEMYVTCAILTALVDDQYSVGRV